MLTCDCKIGGDTGRHIVVLCQGHRELVESHVKAERGECAKLVVHKSQRHADCDYRGMQDPETGEIPCSRRDGCLCDDIADHGDGLAKAIRERK